MRAKLKQMMRPIVPKPWNSPVMEFRYGLWTGVSALFSESGRQLGEENTRPFILNHHIPAETVICNYEGSRDGCMINVSALRIAMKHFDKALPIIGAVRQFHFDNVGKTSPDAMPGTWDLYIIARASIGIVAYRNRFGGQRSSDDALSDTLASLFQFISGVFMICRQMMNSADSTIQENNVVSAEDLYAYADNNGVFLSPNGMACAGGIAKIKEFLEFCISGQRSEPVADSANQKMDLTTVVSDPVNWYRYALATVELDCFTEIECLHRQRALFPAKKAQFDEIEKIYRSVSQYCRDNNEFIGQYTDASSFEEGVLERQNHILTLLERPPIRSISKKHIDERLSIKS